jgi:lipid A 3-O-deacylase
MACIAGGVEQWSGRFRLKGDGSPTLPPAVPYRAAQSMHAYLALDARYVLRDVTLDGNTFRDSVSVDRESLIGDLAIGVALSWRGWRVTFSRDFRTKEFSTDPSDGQFGSVTFRRLYGRR